MDNFLTQLLNHVKTLNEDVYTIKQKLYEINSANYFPEWIPRKVIMQFLDYGDTQMAALLKDPNLKVAEIGARKFVERKSFLEFLEKNIRR